MFKNAVGLYEPILTYKPLADGIGIVDGPLVYMSYPGLSFLSIPFPTRMTVVRLANGDLWLHSPVKYTPELAEELRSLGRVAHLVSPNMLHYAHIMEWKRAFPEALTWASPHVRDRAKGQGIEVEFDRDLGTEIPEEWQGDLQQVIIPGSVVSEVAFFHIRSKTLILTDTIQNFELDKIRQPYRFLVWAARAYSPHGQMPIDLRSTFRMRRTEFVAAIHQMLSWQPERIIMSHGKVIEHDADKAFRFAFRQAIEK